MAKKTSKILIFLVVALLIVPLGSTLYAASNYQPDLQIGYDTTQNYAGGRIYNTDGTNQVLYRILEEFKDTGYRLLIVNNGRYVDRFIITGSASDNYWTINYFDDTGRNITNQVTGSGWYTASLPGGRNERLSMTLSPKKTLGYGQETLFSIRATSVSSGAQDVVKTVVTIRFNNTPQTQENQNGTLIPGPVGPPIENTSNNQGSGNMDGSGGQASGAGYQPDLEIKNNIETSYLGKGLYEKPESILTQIKTQTSNAAFNPIEFNFKLTNADKNSDTFLVKGGGEAKDWQVNYFVRNADKFIDITSQIKNGYRSTLSPTKDQEYKIGVLIPEGAIDQSFAEFNIIAHSINDLGKIDAAKVKVMVDTDLDKDNMNDVCEIKHGLNPKDPKDADQDLDQDWVTNREECAAGTDPRQADSDGDGLIDGAYVENTKLILPGLKSEHFVIAGAVKNIKGVALSNQTIRFNLIDPTDTKEIVEQKSNQEGMVIFQIKNSLLSKPGGYMIQTIGNGKVFQENNFFVSPYGYVYNKKTREPLEGVRVNLWRCNDRCCQYYNSTLTDESGLYNDFMLPAGIYRLKVNEPNFQSYLSKEFTLTKDGVKHNIWLKGKTPLWLTVIYWGLGVLGLIILLIVFYKLKDVWGNREHATYQPDGQIKNSDEQEGEYLGDTVYNLDGLGQTKEQTIGKDDKAIFHIRVQNDGRGFDKFLIQAYPPEKGWGIKFYNVLEEGNDISVQVLGGGWETGNLASGITKDIRVEIWIKDEREINNIYDLPIQITSINDPSKSDVVRARVIFESKKDVDHQNNNSTQDQGQQQV